MNERPALAAVAGALTIAFSAILVKASHASPSTAAFFRCAYALPVLAPLALLERRHGPRSRRELGLSLIAGVFFAADLIVWAYAIEYVGAGLATVLGNLLVQARALGDLPQGVSVRDAARRSSRITEYNSRHDAPHRSAASLAL